MNTGNLLAFMANHLWQSTIVGALAALLALVLRNNHARVRYWLWLTASIKFLVPFALFAGIGSYAHRVHQVPVKPSAAVATLEQWNEPFTFTVPAAAVDVSSKPAHLPASWANVWPECLIILWLSGCVVVAASCYRRWLQMARLVRAARPIRDGREADVLQRIQQDFGLSIPIGIVTSESCIEPGLFGIVHPVLILPVGLGERIAEPQLEAIVAHELCHARRRDNLWAVVHMTVEVVFWFHPLVWWLGSRLIDERERACDEEVLGRGFEPDVYAKAMVEICKSYLAAPVNFVSGVTGSNLERRIEAIMQNRIARRLVLGKKVLLTMIGTVAVCGPIVIGFLNAQQTRAQSTMPPVPKWEVVSVKPCSSNMAASAQAATQASKRGGNAVTGNPRRLDLPCTTTMTLIVMSFFNFADGQVNVGSAVPPPIEGGPSWIDSEYYKITAQTDGDPSAAMMRGPMMQAILEDRFKLKVHRETKEVPAFTLTVAESGLKIQPMMEGDCRRDQSSDNHIFSGTAVYVRRSSSGGAQPAPCDTWTERMMIGPNRMLDFHRSSLAYFSQRLSNIVGRPIIDKTGVGGLFNLHIEFAPDDSTPRYKTMTIDGVIYDANAVAPLPPDASAEVAVREQTRQRLEVQQLEHAKDPAGPSIFGALEQQLGLKLNSGRGPGEFFVIDHVQRPTPN